MDLIQTWFMQPPMTRAYCYRFVKGRDSTYIAHWAHLLRVLLLPVRDMGVKHTLETYHGSIRKGMP